MAKYVTSGYAASATARVAKWGVTIDSKVYSMFLSKYGVKDRESVISVDGSDVVAPGTKNAVDIESAISGTPEVAVEVSTTAEITLENWVADGKYYCPIAFTINGEKRVGTQFLSASEFEKWIEEEVARTTRQYPPGTDLALEPGINLYISWEWEFEGDDEKDTMLGNSDDPATISFSLRQTVVQIESYDEIYKMIDEDTIEFGSYPQSDVTATMGATLNSKIGNALPTADNSNGWTSYEYYIDGKNDTDFMWYIDVTEGRDKYRGVYFTEYRSNSIYNVISDQSTETTITIGNAYQDNYGYYPTNVYWFKYEPIRWKILEEPSDGRALIVCDMIIDGQAYQNEYISKNNRHYNVSEGVPDEIYANNYAYSSIRRWLNETFYNTAFSNLQKKIILTTEVDNSKNSAGYVSWESAAEVVCENTLDRMFLLSYEEASKIETEDRLKKTTEYAMSQGAYAQRKDGQSDDYWWLRSFRLVSSGFTWNNTWSAQIISMAGAFSYLSSEITGTSATYVGVVPAMWIQLSE